MSNPTLATKLVALVKGIFGRKETAATPEPASQEAAGTPQTPAAATAEPGSVTERSGAPEAAAPAPAAKQEPETGADEAESADKPQTEEPAAVAEAVEAEEPAAAEPAAKQEPAETEKDGSGQEPRTEPATPATADIPEAGSAIAEELAAAEAHTKVSSDEILERVRKGAAPSMEDLAVPTYDELTLPSVRARLRKLTIEQVRDLRAYEVAHQSRPEFIKMYDNRIAKLEAEA